jgi:small conductance mechanosensitive channel
MGSISPVDEPIETILETPDLVTRLAIEYGPRVLSALLVLVVGYLVMRWIAGFAERGLARFPLEPPARDLILHAVKLAVFALFVVMALQNLGIDLLPLLAGLGIAGAGIALALQGVLGNVAAGLTIIFTRPFRVGEYVSIAGEEGRVQEISLFSTTLRHADLSQVVIPNRKIVGEILHNYGVIRQLDMSVGVAYATDLDAAVALIREVLLANPRVLQEPPPVVQVSLLGKSAINIAVKPWVAVKDFAPAAGEIYPEIVRAFREREIEIPIPVLRTIMEQVS